MFYRFPYTESRIMHRNFVRTNVTRRLEKIQQLRHLTSEATPSSSSASSPEVPNISDVGVMAPKKTKKMLTEKQTTALSAEGHQLIGGHSSVKMCRWTKNSLKKKGQCYKHTFYGINSHQCMEMTPSLACANRCTFCWRNHSNPITMKWNYDVDDPQWIVEEALALHQKK